MMNERNSLIITVRGSGRCTYSVLSCQLKLIKMRVESAGLNHCAVPFLSRATVTCGGATISTLKWKLPEQTSLFSVLLTLKGPHPHILRLRWCVNKLNSARVNI